MQIYKLFGSLQYKVVKILQNGTIFFCEKIIPIYKNRLSAMGANSLFLKLYK